jgi:hypothetical protein
MTRRSWLLGAGGLASAQPDLHAGLPDFSHAGYRGGGVPLPEAPVRRELGPESGDATARIQAALDDLAARPLEERGALLLTKGGYDIAGTLRLAASGIVLRGEGVNETILHATGPRERSLIEIRGTGAGTAGRAAAILDEVVPLGARRVRVAGAAAFRAGQLVLLRRAGNAAWIREIGMDRIASRPGDPGSTQQWSPFNLDFERTITAIDGDTVTLDAPLLCAIEQRWGGGSLLPFDDSARVHGCGVEYLRGVSHFDPAVTAVRQGERYFSSEAHAHELVTLQNANDCWVRHVASRHFANSCVELGRVRHVTVEDCDNREMVSQITGSRRYSYSLVSAQRCLIQRCFSESGRHDFVVGSRVPGPNVFLDCEAVNAFATSEPHHRWSAGGLYDNVKADIAIQDRQWYGSGHGWSGANYAVWNCEGEIIAQSPPTAENWVIGHIGRRVPGPFEPRPAATWRSFGTRAEPRSLYQHQLSSRLESSQ